MKKLILDLDGTILFGEQRSEALVIRGRRRDSFLARETVNALKNLQNIYDIIIATGRSLPSVKGIINLLSTNGINIAGAVAENGGVWLTGCGKVHFLVKQEWRMNIRKVISLVECRVQEEFMSCVALLSPDQNSVKRLIGLMDGLGLGFYQLRDGNKLFFLAEKANKLNALKYALGIEQLAAATGAGNDLNDIEWLNEIAFPAVPACAKPEAKYVVANKGGMLAVHSGHDGILEILRSLGELTS